MENIKQIKGVTLIALVITIIVLLILAGITINLTIGQDGILKRAQEAGENYTNAADYEREQLAEFLNETDNIINNSNGKILELGTIIKTENNINYTADGIGNVIPVPVGFSPITTQDQGNKNTGFVIKNNDDDNEFVWVPVEGMPYKYDRYSFLTEQPTNGIDSTTNSTKIRASVDSEYNFIELMPTDEQISVEKYGGYYIGRYETGIKEYDASVVKSNTSLLAEWTGYSNGTLVIQSGQQVWNYITRDKAKKVSEALYVKDEDNVISKLCNSYAWDTALKFIETKNSSYPINCVGANTDIDSGGTGILQKTGYDKIHPCNIYDIGGNVAELTTESCSAEELPNTVRRSSYLFTASGDYSPAFRAGGSVAAAAEWIGFRIALYL